MVRFTLLALKSKYFSASGTTAPLISTTSVLMVSTSGGVLTNCIGTTPTPMPMHKARSMRGV